ncbi:hypothetical protein SAMN02910317_02037 [Ruminococcaceae bacterium FB2012]|nr:hypothetical protein SAMN02910317_02037 [Ruminococcaceae bacterium FB2012]
MRKAVYICLIALLLSACANNAQAEKVDTPEISAAVTAATTTTVPSASTTTVSAEEKEIISSSTTIASEESETSSETTESTTSTERENEAATSQTEASVSDKTGSSSITSASVSESKPKVTTVSSVPKNDVTQGTTTTTLPKSTTKKQSSTTTTTAKPRQSSSTTTTKSLEDQYLEELWEIIERKGLQGQDATCLETMVLDLKYSDTPPSYYESVGRGLKHDGTDYGKAKAVYKWMIKNGWGSCVYYSMETYFVCKGIGLECAYGFATDNGWYGHTYSVVKVNGTWYVLDTQGHSFLWNNRQCKRMFDGNDKDMQPFEMHKWYDYDENGEYRDWTIS